MTSNPNPIYIFVDEVGDFNFSPSGSRFFFLTSLVKRRPFKISHHLGAAKLDLLEYGYNFECFHCSQDNKYIRNKVFGIMGSSIDSLEIDSIVIEKRKTGPALQKPRDFYPRMLGYLLRWVFPRVQLVNPSEVIIITDTIPTTQKKRSMEKAIKMSLASMLGGSVKYRIMHHASKSILGLQMVDYCCWALQRKWEYNDSEHYETLRPAIKSEFNIFRRGTTIYY